jgi:hypothetical protein
MMIIQGRIYERQTGWRGVLFKFLAHQVIHNPNKFGDLCFWLSRKLSWLKRYDNAR